MCVTAGNIRLMYGTLLQVQGNQYVATFRRYVLPSFSEVVLGSDCSD
jgi:hypothetical protein